MQILAPLLSRSFCRYAVTRGTFPLTSQVWEEGDVHEQGSTRDTGALEGLIQGVKNLEEDENPENALRSNEDRPRL